MAKIVKSYSLKQTTIELLDKISEREDDTLSTTIDKAVEYYAKEKYGF